MHSFKSAFTKLLATNIPGVLNNSGLIMKHLLPITPKLILIIMIFLKAFSTITTALLIKSVYVSDSQCQFCSTTKTSYSNLPQLTSKCITTSRTFMCLPVEICSLHEHQTDWKLLTTSNCTMDIEVVVSIVIKIGFSLDESINPKLLLCF